MTNERLASAQAFRALQRLYTVLSPDFGENRWRRAHEFEALPPEQRLPGHWYRFESGRGYISVDKDLNGQWYPELPGDVDPACVIVVPALRSAPSLEGAMASSLAQLQASSENVTQFEALFSNLAKLKEPAHETEVLKEFSTIAFAALLAGPEHLLTHLTQRAKYFSGDGVSEGRVTGRDAAAVLLIDELARNISQPGPDRSAPDPKTLARMFGLLVAPGAPSLEHMAARFIQDCYRHGFREQLLATLNALRRKGTDAVESAREGWTVLGHPELQLDIYYEGLFLAAPYVRAAQIGYEVVSTAPDLDEALRKRLATFGNAAEEKLARITDALMFAILDLDGSQFRSLRAEIESLRKSGREDEAQARATERINLKLSYPRPFLSALLKAES